MNKLLYLTQYFPPEIGAGATRAEASVRYLSKHGWDIDVLTEKANYPIGKPYEIDNNGAWPENVNIIRTWVWMSKRETTFKKITFFISFALSSFIYMITKPFRYDVIFVSSPPIFCAFSALIASKLMRVPLVVEIRDMWPDAAFQSERSHTSYWYKIGKWLEHWLYRHSDHIVAVTRRSSEIIGGATDTPVSVVENGVDCERFKPIPRNQIQLDEPVSEGKFRVGFIGSLGIIHDFKNLIQTAKICEQDGDIEFLVIGDGSKHHEFQSLLDQYRPANLHWFGLKEHYKVPHYISSLHVGVNPIVDAEVFKSIVTVKFYEYLACGVPVISATRGAMEELSHNCEAAIVIPPADPEIFAETIFNLKEKTASTPELGERARQFVHQNFNREKLSARLESLLSRFVK